MENEDKKPENTGEVKTVELTPELEAKLEQIKAEDTTKANKKNSKVGPLIAAIVVLLSISAVAVAFTVIKRDSKGGEPQANSSEEKEPEITEVTSSAVKQRIDETVDKLNLVYYGEYSENAKGSDFLTLNYMTTKNEQFFKKLRLTDDEKIFVASTYINIHNSGLLEPVTESDYGAKSIQDAAKKFDISAKDFLATAKKVSAEKFATVYEDIFGEEIKEYKSVEECYGSTIYDEEKEIFYYDVHGGCGGVDFRKILFKKDKYQVKGDEYYLDATVATAIDGQSSASLYCVVFDGFYGSEDNIVINGWDINPQDTRIAAKCNPDAKQSEYEQIMKDGEFSKYRYTFDSDYHFKKIERL